MVQVERSGGKIDYFVYNLGPKGTSGQNNTITEAYQIVRRSLNGDTATFGRGQLVYKSKSNKDSMIYYYIDILHPEANVTFSKTESSCPSVLQGEDNKKPMFRNCFDSELTFDSDEYFYTDIRYNYALWFGLVYMLLFFVFTLQVEPIVPVDFANRDKTAKSFHPFLSIYFYGYDAFTRTSRFTLIFISLAIHMCVCSAFIYQFHPDDLRAADRLEFKDLFKDLNPLLILAAPVAASVAISQVVTFLLGIILYFLKQGHLAYVEKAGRTNDISTLEFYDDEYETVRAKWNFLFYVTTLVIFVCLNVADVFFQLGFHNDYKLVWLADILACFVLDFLVVDVVIAVLASFVEPVGNAVKLRGFHYDYDMHNKFEELEKEE